MAQRGSGLFQMALLCTSTLHYVNPPSDSPCGTCLVLGEEHSLTVLLLPHGIGALGEPCQDARGGVPVGSTILAPTSTKTSPIFQKKNSLKRPIVNSEEEEAKDV